MHSLIKSMMTLLLLSAAATGGLVLSTHFHGPQLAAVMLTVSAVGALVAVAAVPLMLLYALLALLFSPDRAPHVPHRAPKRNGAPA